VGTRRPIAIKLIAAVAALFAVIAIVVFGGSLKMALERGVPLPNLSVADKAVEAILWLALLTTVWRQSRIAVLLALALLAKACVALFLSRSAFTALSSDHTLQIGAILVLVSLIVPVALVESTFRLWRRGILR
jgi:hypothetical protein